MTFTPRIMLSAEFNDPLTAGRVSAAVSVVMQNASVQTGDYGWAFAFNQGAGPISAYLPTGEAVVAAKRIFVFSFAGGLTAGVSKPFAIVRRTQTQGQDLGYLRVNGDEQFEVYDKSNNLVAGPTSHTIRVDGSIDEYHFVVDGLTLDTVWVSLFHETTEVLAEDTGKTWAEFWDTSDPDNILFWGDHLANADKPGATFYADDFISLMSSDSNDAPHITALPRIRGVGLRSILPKAAGTHGAWTGDFNDVDEEPPDAVDVIDTDTKGAKETYKWTDANPVPALNGGRIWKAQIRGVGRLKAGGKLGAQWMFRDNAANEDFGHSLTWTTDWTAPIASFLLAPDGGAWARADFDPANDMEYGAVSLDQPTIDTGIEVDCLPGPEIAYHTTTIPIANVTTPSHSFAIRPRGIAHLIGR